MNSKRNEDRSRYIKAASKVKKIKEFYSHLLVFILVIPFLIFINLKLTPQFHWFWFSILGWGIGLASHAFQIFEGYKIFLGKNWEEQKIQEILKKEEYHGK